MIFNSKIIFLILFLTQLFLSCDDVDDPNFVKITTENINPASNNDVIIAQQKYYISGQTKSSVYEIITDYKGKYYFYGNDGVLGELDNIGSLVWQKNVGYNISDMKLIQGYLVTVGSPYSSSNVSFFKDIQKISSFKTSGELKDDYSITLNGKKLRINSITSKYETFEGFIQPTYNNSESSFEIMAGGALNNGSDFYPYFTTLTMNKITGQFSPVTGTDVILYTRNKSISSCLSIKYSNNEGYKYYCLLKNLSSDSTTAKVNNVYVAKYNSTMTEMWNKELKGENNLKFDPNELFVQNNFSDNDPIYIVGSTESLSKGKSGDEYWKSGYIYSIDNVGVTNFQKSISYSIKVEKINDIAFSNDGYLYLCGNHSQYVLTSGENGFGNGLVVKMDMSGNISKSWTLGEKTIQSGFNTICLIGNNLLLGGFTYESFKEDKWKNWLTLIAK